METAKENKIANKPNKLHYQGASAQAIQYHYDLSNEFYQLWLDTTCSYSCALWEDAETLEEAQIKKLDYHITQAGAQEAQHVLDIGCGWGSILKRLVNQYHVKQAVGLTLSQAQQDWIATWNHPQIDVRLEGWAEHQPEIPYDAIISIGAFEHFANTKLSSAEKVDAYRNFFNRCHEWLKPGGRISLQTIIYENAGEEDVNSFLSQEIFPDSALPRLAEIVQAAERIFEIDILRNDREYYVRTLRAWLKNLRANRAEAIQLVGEKQVAAYEKYFGIAMIGFHSGNLNLSRISLKRIDAPRFNKH